MQCWWCDPLHRQLYRCSCFYWDTRCSMDHLLENMVFRFDTNLWSLCISNAAVIKEKWGYNRKHFEAKLHKYITFLYKDLCIFILYCTGKKSEGRTYLPIHVSLDLLSSFLCSIRQLVNYQGVLVRCSQNALELKHQLLKKTIGWSPTVHKESWRAGWMTCCNIKKWIIRFV